ncbi:LysR family transcriptional regulator [Labrys sp. La1]|uniref:LysR family transcriptional regulator n=1 Tax=Labrys sp. La1 TaxID=3404917 RepID=UPI003EBD7295
MISLGRLEIFRAVVETGSFTAAATRIGQARAVVSFNVKQLEGDLGIPLFSRTTRRVVPTAAGERFYARCVDMLETARLAIEEARGEHADLTGTLRLTTTVEYGLTRIVPALQAFMRLHPALRVQIETHSLETDLVRERFDVAIRLGELSRLRDLGYKAVRLDTFEMRPVIAPDLLAASGRKRIDTPTALDDYPRLGHRRLEQVPAWDLKDSAGGSHAYRPAGEPCLLADNASILRAFALRGAGFALLPQWLVQDDLAKGRLLDALPDYRFPAQNVYALYPAAGQLPRKVRSWIDFVKAHLARSSASGSERSA